MALKDKRIAILLFIIFLVSLSYSFYFQAKPRVDAKAYDAIAWNLAQGLGYRETLTGPMDKDNSIIRVGPGYELFLASIYFIFGHNYKAVWVIQAILLALASLFIFLSCKEIFEDEKRAWLIGLISAILIGLSPDLITMSGLLMTETLGTFFIALTILLFLKYYNSEKKSFWALLGLGASLAAAVSVRTPAGFLIIPILYYFIREKRWREFIVLPLICILLFSPWIVRNYTIFKTFIPTNVAYGIDFFAGNHPGASGELEPYGPADDIIKNYGYVDGTRLAMQEGLKFVISSPLEFLKITLHRISIYFSFARPTGFWFHLIGISRIITLISSAIFSVILFIFGFFGISEIRKLSDEEKRKTKLILFMLVMMPLSIVGIIVETRYRFLSYPFFAIFAGYGISQLSLSNIRQFSYVVAILFLNSVIDVFKNFGRIIDKLS